MSYNLQQDQSEMSFSSKQYSSGPPRGTLGCTKKENYGTFIIFQELIFLLFIKFVAAQLRIIVIHKSKWDHQKFNYLK
jgi:hypothetical protein